MSLIRKKGLKFIKLCLVSPILDYLISIVYLVTLPIVIFKFSSITPNLSNYDITQIVRQELLEDSFRNISSSEHFISYLDNLVDTLYNPKDFPLLIPVSSIQLRSYSVNDQNCLIPACSAPTDGKRFYCKLSAVCYKIQVSVINNCSQLYSQDINNISSQPSLNHYYNSSFYEKVL